MLVNFVEKYKPDRNYDLEELINVIRFEMKIAQVIRHTCIFNCPTWNEKFF